MIKTLNKPGIEGNFLKVIKEICKKLSTKIMLNGERLNVFPLRVGARQGSHPLSASIQHQTGGSPGQGNGVTAVGGKASFRDDKNVLNLGHSDGCATLKICYKNHSTVHFQQLNFMVCKLDFKITVKKSLRYQMTNDKC